MIDSGRVRDHWNTSPTHSDSSWSWKPRTIGTFSGYEISRCSRIPLIPPCSIHAEIPEHLQQTTAWARARPVINDKSTLALMHRVHCCSSRHDSLTTPFFGRVTGAASRVRSSSLSIEFRVCFERMRERVGPTQRMMAGAHARLPAHA